MSRKIIVVPDTHCPYQSESAVEVALKITYWYKPDRIIFLGDFLDYFSLSRFAEESVAARAAASMKDEFAEGNRVMDKFTKHCKDIVYLEGNHESRYKDYLDKHPEVKGLVEPEVGLNFRDRRKAGYKIKHYTYNECHKEGNLYFTHGLYTTQNHAAKHVQSFGRNLVYGHIHDVQMATHVSPIDISRKHMALCLGCLCDRNPTYLRNAPSKWVHCLGVVHIRDNGDFNVDPIVISDGVASYGGKVFYAC